MREGLLAFFAGGYRRLDGETLARVRSAADEALKEGKHAPVPGGPVAPAGYMWHNLPDAREALGEFGHEVRHRLEVDGEQISSVLGGTREWGLEGPIEGYHLEVDDDPMSMLPPGDQFNVWVLVLRAPNWGREPEWQGEWPWEG
jgi:hypothetical protein